MTILSSLLISIVVLVVIGIELQTEQGVPVQTKQRIEPTTITECSNGNCDTTYVYDFNTK